MNNAKGDGSANLQQQLNDLVQAKTKLEVQIDQLQVSLKKQFKLLDALKSSTDTSSKQIATLSDSIQHQSDVCDKLTRLASDLANEQSYLDKQRLSEDALTKLNVKIATCGNELM